MENMVKGLTVPKLVLIVWPKIPQVPQNLSAQFVCRSTEGLDFNEKRLHLASVKSILYKIPVNYFKGLNCSVHMYCFDKKHRNCDSDNVTTLDGITLNI